jgi:hypothetical protein
LRNRPDKFKNKRRMSFKRTDIDDNEKARQVLTGNVLAPVESPAEMQEIILDAGYETIGLYNGEEGLLRQVSDEEAIHAGLVVANFMAQAEYEERTFYHVGVGFLNIGHAAVIIIPATWHKDDERYSDTGFVAYGKVDYLERNPDGSMNVELVNDSYTLNLNNVFDGVLIFSAPPFVGK